MATDLQVPGSASDPTTASFASITTTGSSLGVRAFRHPFTVPVGIGLIGFLIAVAGIAVPSIWYDEAATITSASRTWAQLWAEIHTVDAVHALYYAGIHLVFDVFGYSPTSLRMPSAIATGVAAALVVVLARQLTGPRIAVIAGLVFCILPRVTWMGTEGRSYALTVVLATLMTIVMVHASRSTRKRWWVLYGILIVVSCVVFIYLALIVIAHAVTMLWRLSSARLDLPPGSPFPQGTARMSQRWLVSSGLAGIALLPFGLVVIGQTGQLHWIKPISRATFGEVVLTQWFYNDPWFSVLGWLLLVTGSVIVISRFHTRWSGLSASAVLLPALLMPTLILLVATAVYTPLYTPRYLSMCLPFVAIVMASALAALPTRAIAILVLGALVCLSIPQIIAQRKPAAKENTAWEQVASVIATNRAQASPGAITAIIYGPVRYHASASTRVIAYSYPAAFAGTIDVTLGIPAAETGRLWETRIPLPDSSERLETADVTYLVTSIDRDIRPSAASTLAIHGWRQTDQWRVADVNIVKFER